MRERERERDCKLKHSFETDWRKKNSGLYNTKGKNKRWFFFCSRHKEDKLGFSLDWLFECYNHIELKYSKEFQSSILEQVDIFLEPSIRESDKMRISTFQC